MPIFDEDQQHIYVHFVKEQYPSKLEIAKIEYFYRGKNHPWYVIQHGQVRYTFGKFDTLQKGRYNLLKTNGQVDQILFIENKLESNGEWLVSNLYYLDTQNEPTILSYDNIVDIY